jgi:phosphatidate cytidylyltransferase
LLATRVATAIVGIPIIFGLIWIGGWPYAVVVAVVLGVAAAEFAHLRLEWTHAATSVAVAIAALFAIMGHIEPRSIPVAAVLCFALPVAGLGGLVGNKLRLGLDASAENNALQFIAGMAYVAVLGSTIVLLRDLDNGRDWVYLALFSTFSVDTTAYFVGRAIGRHKLAPAISPKKTWEGFFGGYAGGFAAVLLLNHFLGLRIDAGPALLIALTLPVAAALGDLFESWVKRRAGVKDASELIPGHGGVLDRLDSVLFVFPLVYIVARFVV